MDKVFDVAGAIINKSAHKPKSTWLFQTAFLFFLSKNSDKTGLFDNVDKVSGVTKSFADGVIITWTLAPFLIKSLSKNIDL